MPVRIGEAYWQGTLFEGQGTMRVHSGVFESPYSAATRFENKSGTNPEELIGAAHAGCFSMEFANKLTQVGYTAEQIHTRSRVHLEKVEDGFKISRIELLTEAKVPDISNELFQEQANKAKNTCPVSKALSVPISIEANLSEQVSE